MEKVQREGMERRGEGEWGEGQDRTDPPTPLICSVHTTMMKGNYKLLQVHVTNSTSRGNLPVHDAIDGQPGGYFLFKQEIFQIQTKYLPSQTR